MNYSSGNQDSVRSNVIESSTKEATPSMKRNVTPSLQYLNPVTIVRPGSQNRIVSYMVHGNTGAYQEIEASRSTPA